jgi:Recombination endonuclease VII
MIDEDFLNQPLELPLEPTKRKRKKRWGCKYPVPVATPEERAVLRAFQENKCAVCGAEGELHLDHSRRNNRLRGYLCRRCNTGLGQFHDSRKLLEAAIRYLRDTPYQRMLSHQEANSRLGVGEAEKERDTR